MEIAVCEDQREEAEWLCGIIQKWALEKGIVATVRSFSDAASFLFSFNDGAYDALFLDIKMSGEDGMSLARRLRKEHCDVPIVFVTGEEEYIQEGYEVEAVNYLLKPVQEKRVFQSLDRIYAKQSEQEPYLLLKTEDATVKVLQKELYQVEVYAHRLVYISSKGTFETYSSLKEAKKELLEHCFVECYRGILVNLFYVESIAKNSLMLYDGKTGYRAEIPVSRRMYDKLNEAFIAFYRTGK